MDEIQEPLPACPICEESDSVVRVGSGGVAPVYRCNDCQCNFTQPYTP